MPSRPESADSRLSVRTSGSYAFALRNHDTGHCQGARSSDAMALVKRRGFLPPAVGTSKNFIPRSGVYIQRFQSSGDRSLVTESLNRERTPRLR